MYKCYLKRFIDFSLAIFGLVILSPVFLLIYIILFISNDKDPFFKQPRPGLNEKVFNILKFKSMSDKKDRNGNLLPDIERVTKFGTFIRKTSLDEIPQLLNVLKGDMSLVGPRPLRVRYLPYYKVKEKIRHTVRPGVTGLAQVSGRNKLNWDQKLAKDIEYVNNLSFFLDIIILLKTVKKIFNTSDIDFDVNANALDEYRSQQQGRELLRINKSLSIYRDDLYPQFGGGNKARKMNALHAKITKEKYKAIVTTGGIQSNHCRVVALYCKEHGLDCTLILHGEKERFYTENGNCELMRKSGVKVIFCESNEISKLMNKSIKKYTQKGIKAYYLYGGGHTIEGGNAYFNLTKKIINNYNVPDYIFVPCGTGTTQAGIMTAIKKMNLPTKVIGISIGRPKEKAIKATLNIYNNLCSVYNILPNKNDIIINDSFLCGGYEMFNSEIESLAKTSTQKYGIPLDTTYTAKAFYGMQQIIKEQNLQGNILFWYTGGQSINLIND